MKDKNAIVAPFVYRPAPGVAVKGRVAASADGGSGTPVISAAELLENLPGAGGDPQAQQKEAWDRGFRDGAENVRGELEALVNQQRDALTIAIAEFARERQAYFSGVEGEVVSLALAIVRKILHRESQVDPLLLKGMVHVALEKMTVSQNVKLYVHPNQLREWQDYFFGHSDLPLVPEVLSDSTLDQNQCRIEADHGTTDLHLDVQLKEIEQGLFDLLAQKPVAH